MEIEVGNAITILSYLKNYKDQRITSPDTVTITIIPPSGVAVVSDAGMTLEIEGKYKNSFKYIWQSDVTSEKGVYSAEIKSTYSGYNALQTIAEAFVLI